MKCIRCGSETYSQKICTPCLSEWSAMKNDAVTVLEEKFGRLSPLNHKIITQEVKRLERIWRKDREKFKAELSKHKII